ncbi:hypothetical protein ACIQAC_01435 [Streptomyces sp. NPDC088387]|uniref:hypothetical protein n=1 Tax=Streptomyces sp. NPDC088387 TaxID=3365859 RepID=UPI00382BD2C7
MPVRRSKYDDLRARYERALEERNTALADAEGHVCTIVRLSGEVDDLREQLKTPGAGPGRLTRGEGELRRLLGLAEEARRSLYEQCRTLQASNEAMAAELRDLREGSEAGG